MEVRFQTIVLHELEQINESSPLQVLLVEVSDSFEPFKQPSHRPLQGAGIWPLRFNMLLLEEFQLPYNLWSLLTFLILFYYERFVVVLHNDLLLRIKRN